MNGADAMENGVPNQTLEKITEELTFDKRPTGPDGCSNVDRIAFISQVFQTNVIDLSLAYDFTAITQYDDPMEIEAAKHLALLKLDYFNRMYDNFLLTFEQHAEYVAPLILAVQRINWHLQFVRAGLPTPPFSAFG